MCLTTEPIKELMKEIVDMTKKCGRGWRFQNMDHQVIQQWIATISEELTEDDLIEISASKPVPNNEEEDVEEAISESKLA